MNVSFKVLFICTWAADEPYLEVLKAAKRLPASVHIYVTGRSRGRERALEDTVPDNVTLTGFVSEEEFIELLQTADAVVDLTTREDCLVCGAYEATAAEKPLLLSNTKALRSYFHKGALFTDNTAADIARQLLQLRNEHTRLMQEVAELKQDLSLNWQKYRTGILDLLEQLEAGLSIQTA
ncbi:hypothetical protein CAI21_19865 [Alkalilimnicola ehrlichii]|uniref:Glycosyl transferase family 1 domain-containing protein n=1 Tax=Alkalilimnicola ehrlichii TaxID=351052 RepID=A0A3E0WJ22_9GAMM|nr:glycosyltransferase [Alkalilimnicola ehrlichii]RFA25153.1 hypothetical protein CAI21_19865 [Alkalilimnicola ehrlichii]RFA32107.1 hypothetical protein CAL65_20445 [Alkalilimnicola ehrlichii]